MSDLCMHFYMRLCLCKWGCVVLICGYPHVCMQFPVCACSCAMNDSVRLNVCMHGCAVCWVFSASLHNAVTAHDTRLHCLLGTHKAEYKKGLDMQDFS